VLYGRCDDELGVPFQPFVEALEYFVGYSPTDGLRERLGRHAGELVRLAPELARKIADLPPPLTSDAETERYRMFDAVAAWLIAASAERPLVLILDDLHWAAKPTLLLLKHILRSPQASGGVGVSPAHLLLIGTYRDTELNRSPICAKTRPCSASPCVGSISPEWKHSSPGRPAMTSTMPAARWRARSTPRPRATRSSSARCCGISANPAPWCSAMAAG